MYIGPTKKLEKNMLIRIFSAGFPSSGGNNIVLLQMETENLLIQVNE